MMTLGEAIRQSWPKKLVVAHERGKVILAYDGTWVRMTPEEARRISALISVHADRGERAMVVDLFDPHEPGAGCSEPLPPPVVQLLNGLNGKRLCLADAIYAIKEVCPDADVNDHGDYIGLERGPEVKVTESYSTRKFRYRAICYRVATDAVLPESDSRQAAV